MKTSNTTRCAALFVSITLSLTAIQLIAGYALPAERPVPLALATPR